MPRVLGQVQAVLVGRSETYTRPGTRSAIAKCPVTGRVSAGPLGLAGDEQADRHVHGGPDKALHLYAFEHYAAWRRELGHSALLAAPGAFGENLSTLGVTEDQLCLGDRLRIGTAVLEVAQGRQPCWKLNDRFAVPDMARRLQQSLRTGWYCRVVTAGEVGAGDALELLARPHADWSIARLMRVLYEPCLDTVVLLGMRELPLVPGWRKIVEYRLESGQAEDWQRRLAGPTVRG